MPAIQIEISKEKDEKRCRQHSFSTGAINLLAPLGGGNNFLPEAKINTDISQHRPSKRSRGRKNHGTAHHKDNGEEQSEEPGNANHNAAIKRQAILLVFIIIGIPQIELRQMRCCQFGDISDRGTGIEHDFENIGFGIVFPLRAFALAGRHSGDA